MARGFASASSQAVQRQTSGFPVTGYPVSFACWFNATTLTAVQCLMNISTVNTGGTAYGIGIRVDTSGHALATCWASGGDVTTSATIATGAWHHLAATFASATVRAIYLDGANKVTGSTSEAWGTSSFIYVGTGMAAGIKYTNGAIAFSGIWNVALSDTDVTSLSNGAHPLLIRPDALIACPDFTPGTLSPSPDLVSVSNWSQLAGSTDVANPRIYV